MTTDHQITQQTPAPATPSSKTQEALSHAVQVLALFHDITPDFPILYALCLIEIAKDEGLSITSLADRTGAPLSTISRVVGALSNARQRGQAFQLVQTQTSKTERRKKELFLTTKGKALIATLANG